MMPDNRNESRKRWNAANYKQINIAVRPALSEAFRAACERNGISMREAFTGFMATYAEATPVLKKPKDTNYNERSRRRKAVEAAICQLLAVRDAEEMYKENIPDNLKSSSRYAAAEQAVEILEEAIALLNEAFT